MLTQLFDLSESIINDRVRWFVTHTTHRFFERLATITSSIDSGRPVTRLERIATRLGVHSEYKSSEIRLLLHNQDVCLTDEFTLHFFSGSVKKFYPIRCRQT
jgi:hypothetical protein